MRVALNIKFQELQINTKSGNTITATSFTPEFTDMNTLRITLDKGYNDLISINNIIGWGVPVAVSKISFYNESNIFIKSIDITPSSIQNNSLQIN
jgi:hypothetical protein